MKHGEFTSELAPGERRMFIDVMLIQEEFERYSMQVIAILCASISTQGSCYSP